MSKLTSLYINSKNRNSGNSSDYIMYLTSLGLQPGQYGSFSIKNASIPFSYYATSYTTSTGPQEFSFQNPDGLFVFSIPAGNYTPTAIIAAILPLLQAHGTFSMSYSLITGKFTIESDTIFDIYFKNSTNATYPYQRLGLILGFLNDLTGASSYTSDIVANLTGPNNLYIRSNAWSYDQVTNYFNNGMNGIIAVIPVNTGPLNVINYMDQMIFKQPFKASQMNQFDIQLVDEFCVPVDLNGLDWTFTICIYNDGI